MPVGNEDIPRPDEIGGLVPADAERAALFDLAEVAIDGLEEFKVDVCVWFAIVEDLESVFDRQLFAVTKLHPRRSASSRTKIPNCSR